MIIYKQFQTTTFGTFINSCTKSLLKTAMTHSFDYAMKDFPDVDLKKPVAMDT